jgi:hypothetical protein
MKWLRNGARTDTERRARRQSLEESQGFLMRYSTDMQKGRQSTITFTLFRKEKWLKGCSLPILCTAILAMLFLTLHNHHSRLKISIPWFATTCMRYLLMFCVRPFADDIHFQTQLSVELHIDTLSCKRCLQLSGWLF